MGAPEDHPTREVSIPLLVERPDLRNVSDLLAERLRIDPEHVALARRVDGSLLDVTTGDFDAEVLAVARGLVAVGVQPGDRVAIMSPTRYEWALVSFAVWAAGAVVVPVYETSSVVQVESIIDVCGVRLAFVAGDLARETLAAVGGDLDTWSMEPELSSGPDPLAQDLSALIAQGAGAAVPDEEVRRRSALASRDDLASIVFTSGTTGGQKGVRITHGNFVGLVTQVAAAYDEVVHDRAVTVILLPLAHVLAQGLQLVSIHAGMKVVHESDPTSAVATMGEVRPTFMVVVPRVLEKIRSAARSKAAERHADRIFGMAERTAIAWGEHLERRQEQPHLRPPRGLSLRHTVFDRLFYAKLRELLGGRVEYLLSGAAPLDASLGNFYRGMGVPVIEGYGLSETTAPVTGNRPGRMRAGSVGVPIPGSTVRIADDGEVLVRGVGVSPGYLNERDDDAAYVDGFFRTGDLGELDADGYLYLHGRSKNILVTASGKNVAPEPWEQAVATDPLVAQAVVVGDGRPYVSALVLVDIDEAIPWAARRRSTELVETLRAAAASTGPALRITSEELVAHIGRTVARANASVSRAEQVRRFSVLVATLTEQDRTLTPTLKLRRAEFLAQAAPHVADLYDERSSS